MLAIQLGDQAYIAMSMSPPQEAPVPLAHVVEVLPRQILKVGQGLVGYGVITEAGTGLLLGLDF